MKGIDCRVSFDSKEEREENAAYAKAKGLTLPALLKFALYQYKTKYPLSASQMAGERRLRGRPPKKNQAVQPELSGGNSEGRP